MNIEKDEFLRKGQQISNFLIWLQQEKGYYPHPHNSLADPYYIPDQEFDALWREYLEYIQIMKEHGLSKKEEFE